MTLQSVTMEPFGCPSRPHRNHVAWHLDDFRPERRRRSDVPPAPWSAGGASDRPLGHHRQGEAEAEARGIQTRSTGLTPEHVPPASVAIIRIASPRRSPFEPRLTRHVTKCYE